MSERNRRGGKQKRETKTPWAFALALIFPRNVFLVQYIQQYRAAPNKISHITPDTLLRTSTTRIGAGTCSFQRRSRQDKIWESLNLRTCSQLINTACYVGVIKKNEAKSEKVLSPPMFAWHHFFIIVSYFLLLPRVVHGTIEQAQPSTSTEQLLM